MIKLLHIGWAVFASFAKVIGKRSREKKIKEVKSEAEQNKKNE